MRTVVIGGGLIGVTTAYFLRRNGFDVTVVERRAGPGRETSFANGGLLTPSMSDPWNAPGCWRVLLASLVRPDAPLKLHLRALPEIAGWGVAFLRNSGRRAFERNTMCNLRLALYSKEVMSSIRSQLQIEYGRTARGTLRIFRSAEALERAAVAASRLTDGSVRFRRLSPAQASEMNPALGPLEGQLSGALHYEEDETGDAHRFCTALAEKAQSLGVTFLFDTEISALELRAGRVAAAVGQSGRLVADRYVVACGSYSTALLRSAGIALPVRPAKGYSLTFDQTPKRPLHVPVVDDDLHAAVVPINGSIRVAGTAEFSGYDLALRPVRIDNLRRLLQRVLPEEHFDATLARPWCGLRPMSADGVPIIGPTSVPNLLVNTGHGHLGWTLAAGSARLLADLISESSPAIDPAAYSIARFR